MCIISIFKSFQIDNNCYKGLLINLKKIFRNDLKGTFKHVKDLNEKWGFGINEIPVKSGIIFVQKIFQIN